MLSPVALSPSHRLSGAGHGINQQVLNSSTATGQREGKELEESGSRNSAISAGQELRYSQACRRARAALPAPQGPASTQRAAEHGLIPPGMQRPRSVEPGACGKSHHQSHQVRGAARQQPRSLLLLLRAGRQREHTRAPSPSTAALVAAMAPPAPSR